MHSALDMSPSFRPSTSLCLLVLCWLLKMKDGIMITHMVKLHLHTAKELRSEKPIGIERNYIRR